MKDPMRVFAVVQPDGHTGKVVELFQNKIDAQTYVDEHEYSEHYIVMWQVH